MDFGISSFRIPKVRPFSLAAVELANFVAGPPPPPPPPLLVFQFPYVSFFFESGGSFFTHRVTDAAPLCFWGSDGDRGFVGSGRSASSAWAKVGSEQEKRFEISARVWAYSINGGSKWPTWRMRLRLGDRPLGDTGGGRISTIANIGRSMGI